MAHKGYCEDITEGKFSLPVIHAVRSQPDNHQLLSTVCADRSVSLAGWLGWLAETAECMAAHTDILKQKTDNVEVVTYAVKVIRDAGSLAYTVGVLRRFEAAARHEVDRLGPNPAVTRILDALAEVYKDVNP